MASQAEVKTESPQSSDMVERLRRHRTGAYRRLLVNPDGLEAADTIEELVEALRQIEKYTSDTLAKGRASAALALIGGAR